MRRSVVAALLAALALFAYMPQGTAGEEPTPLLPNLRPRTTSDIYLEKDGDKRKIRFTTDVVNLGVGPFELRPKSVLGCKGNEDNYIARQFIYLDDGSGVYERDDDVDTTHHRVGCFTYHEPHNHWHFMDFADYALFKVKADGTLRNEPSATSDKISFCMMDTYPSGKDLPGKPSSGVYKAHGAGGCTSEDPSGISIGWTDHYGSDLPGQALNVKGLKPGPYCISVSLDPRNVLEETDDTDNTRLTWVRVGQERIRVRYAKDCPS